MGAILTTWINSNFFSYIIKTKRANPRKRICPYWKTISHEFFGYETCVLILAKTATWREFIPTAYIWKSIKNQRANPRKRICPIEKTISQGFNWYDIVIFIAGIQSSTIKKADQHDPAFWALIKYEVEIFGFYLDLLIYFSAIVSKFKISSGFVAFKILLITLLLFYNIHL